MEFFEKKVVGLCFTSEEYKIVEQAYRLLHEICYEFEDTIIQNFIISGNSYDAKNQTIDLENTRDNLKFILDNVEIHD